MKAQRASPLMQVAMRASPCGAARGALIAVIAFAAQSAQADALDDLLAIVPKDATTIVAVASLSKLSVDVDACIAAMDRKESVIAGRPIDQIRGWLEVREGFDERGSFAAWTLKTAPPDAAAAGEAQAPPQWTLLIPSEDPAAFIVSNIAPDASGAGKLRGETVYSRALAKHVIVSTLKSAVDGYEPAGGVGSDFAAKFGERALARARAGEVFAWARGKALVENGLVSALSENLGTGDRLREFFAGATDGLLVADVDALGLSLRAFAVVAPESDLAKVCAGATAMTGEGAATLGKLPKSPFYCAFAVDATAMGGAGKLDELASALALSDAMPAWLAEAKDGVRGIRFACYPSKLGLLAGGLLNDCACVIETDRPAVIRDLFKSSLMAQTGNAEGVRREPAWEDSRTLKSGLVVEAFELKETPLGPSEAKGEDLGNLAMRQMMRQAIFGSRGMHGFVKVLPNAVVVTFSQRPDVLDRAVAAVAGGESLQDDSVLVAMRPWLVQGAQCEAFISVGQLLKVVRQLASAFGGGEFQLPTIPSRSPPVALALKVEPSSIEAAVMIPTATIAAIYDQAMSGAMGGPQLGPGNRGAPKDSPQDSPKDSQSE